MSHFIGPSCSGVTCHMCRERPATHKVGEEFLDDTGYTFDDLVKSTDVDPYRNTMRHNLTAYVCCECFGNIMGPLAVAWCGLP